MRKLKKVKFKLEAYLEYNESEIPIRVAEAINRLDMGRSFRRNASLWDDNPDPDKDIILRWIRQTNSFSSSYMPEAWVLLYDTEYNK